jgi:orotate phosphoribosyltransferase
MNDRDRLKALLVKRSIRLGNFTLASGARSEYYIDARLTTMSAEGQVLVGRAAYEEIRSSGLEPSHVGGLTLGADPIAYAIAHRSALEGHSIDAFTVRKEPKAHGTGQQVEGGLAAGDRCLLVEDTMTTGRSTLQALKVVRNHGVTVLGVLTIVNRSDTAAELYQGEGLPLIALFTGEELLEAARTTR